MEYFSQCQSAGVTGVEMPRTGPRGSWYISVYFPCSSRDAAADASWLICGMPARSPGARLRTLYHEPVEEVHPVHSLYPQPAVGYTCFHSSASVPCV